MATNDLTHQALSELIQIVRDNLQTRRGEPADPGSQDFILPSRKELKNACDEAESFLEPYNAVTHTHHALYILGAIFTLQDAEPGFMSSGKLRLRNICNNLGTCLKSD